MIKLISICLVCFFIIGCNDYKEKYEKHNSVENDDCVKLNDSALNLLLNNNGNLSSIKLINQAITCDPNNWSFYFNKRLILHTLNRYQECIDFMIENKKKFNQEMYLSSLAECNYFLDNVEKYDSCKSTLIEISKRKFEKNKNENNLMQYLGVLKRFDDEQSAFKILSSNKNLFKTKELYNLNKVSLSEIKNLPPLPTRTYSPSDCREIK